MYLSVYVSVVLCWIYNYNGVSLSSFYGEGNLCVNLYCTTHMCILSMYMCTTNVFTSQLICCVWCLYVYISKYVG